MMVGKQLIQDNQFMDKIRTAEDGDAFAVYSKGKYILLKVEVKDGYGGLGPSAVAFDENSWVEKHMIPQSDKP